MGLYVAKRVEVEAVQYTGPSVNEHSKNSRLNMTIPSAIEYFFKDRAPIFMDITGETIIIGEKSYDVMYLDRGNWAVRLPNGRIQICSPEYFEEVYERRVN